MSLTLRPSTCADLPFLWFCRNDPTMRAAAKRQHEIPWDEIRNWSLLIAEHEGMPAGYARAIDHELTWYIAPMFRRKGLGTEMISQLARLPNGPWTAEVRSENLTSQRAAQRAGLMIESANAGYVHMTTGRG